MTTTNEKSLLRVFTRIHTYIMQPPISHNNVNTEYNFFTRKQREGTFEINKDTRTGEASNIRAIEGRVETKRRTNKLE